MNEQIEDRLIDYILNTYDEVGRADEGFLNTELERMGAKPGFGTLVLDAYEALPAQRQMKLSRPEPFDQSLRNWLQSLPEVATTPPPSGLLQINLLVNKREGIDLLIVHPKLGMLKAGEIFDDIDGHDGLVFAELVARDFNEYPQLKERMEKADKLLEQLEWSLWSEGHQTCPVCREAYKYGHRNDCELGLAFAAERGTRFHHNQGY